MKKIKVSCAIIEIDDKTLVVQRNKNMSLAFKWEFPGGKIENGESDVECVLREIKEELNIKIRIISRLTPSNYHYPEHTVLLIPFLCRYVGGNICLSEHKEYKLLSKDKLINLDWSAADIPVLNEYLGQ